MRSFLIFLCVGFFSFLIAADPITRGNLSGGGIGSLSSSLGAPPTGAQSNMIMSPGVTYAIESFDASIGYKDQTPNVLSTLDWKKYHVMGATLSGEAPAGTIPIIYEGFFGVIRKNKGSFIDRDYAGNDKTLLWSETVGQITGKALDGSLAVALLKEGGFRALVGGIYTKRDYEMRESRQTQSTPANYLILDPANTNPPGAVGTVYAGKNGTYTFQIYGPWVGGDMKLNVMKDVTIRAMVKAVYGFYRAKGVWPSKSFEDKSKAYGGQGKLGFDLSVIDGMDMFIDLGLKYYKVKRGSVKTKSGTSIDFFRGGVFKSYSASVGGNIKF